jgi:hypothetical protein
MMLFNRDSAIQKCFQKILHSLQVKKFSSLSAVRTPNCPKHHPSRRRGFPFGHPSVKASSVRTTRSFRPDAHQCLEASNSSRWHPSGRNGKSSGCSSEFEKIPMFQRIRSDAIQCLTSIRVSTSRHSYGKMPMIVRTMCYPVRTMFSIRQDVHTKFNRPDVSLHGSDDQASYMKIACTSSTVQTLAFRVRMLNALLW